MGWIFEAKRKTDTGDPLDYVIELDKDLVLNYAYNLLTDDFIYHGTGNRKAIGIRFRSTGKVSPYSEASLPLNPYWVFLAWNEWF
jgi:hypothetical protein